MTRNDEGASPVSILIILVLMFMIVELIALGGRIASAHLHVAGAAREGARRASLAQTEARAEVLGEEIAEANLDDRCAERDADPDVTNFGAGGTVVVEAKCRVDLSAFSVLSLPWPHLDMQSEATEIVETYRAVGTP